jgi:hypothetical protein
LEFCEFFVEFVFVDAARGYARGYGVGDFFADGVLFAEIFPVIKLLVHTRGFGGGMWGVVGEGGRRT